MQTKPCHLVILKTVDKNEEVGQTYFTFGDKLFLSNNAQVQERQTTSFCYVLTKKLQRLDLCTQDDLQFVQILCDQCWVTSKMKVTKASGGLGDTEVFMTVTPSLLTAWWLLLASVDSVSHSWAHWLQRALHFQTKWCIHVVQWGLGYCGGIQLVSKGYPGSP